ncbi:MAG TPA: hypothetical protein V6C85_27070 [Allocoleopsis sp.]
MRSPLALPLGQSHGCNDALEMRSLYFLIRNANGVVSNVEAVVGT